MLKKIIFSLTIFLNVILVHSCGKKEDQQTFIPPPGETTVDKEKEQKEREEFERLKRLEMGITDSMLALDSLSMSGDSSNVNSGQKEDSKNLVQKEKELNKRLDNPKVTINDYIELLQRGTSSSGNFEQNMKKASQLWETSNIDRFKTNYKNTKKIIVVDEPKVISQQGNTAIVEVRLKKVDNKNNKDEELDMVVKYNLVADSKGKWKIKDNIVEKK